MKKCLLKGGLLPILLFAGLFCELSVRSQSVIFSSGHLSEFSIVRNYTNNVDITYSVLVNEHCFNYVDRNTLTMLCAPLPSLFTVNDMEIYNDSVFFCGMINGVAMYGYFDIYDLFFGLGNVRYFLASGLTGYNIYSFRRLAVGSTPSGKTHMVMVGFGYYESSKDTIPKQRYYTPSVIADAWIDGSGANQFHFTVDIAEEYRFDDVIINDSWAVVTAQGNGQDNYGTHNVFYYKSPGMQNESIFDVWIPIGDIATTPYWKTDASVLLSAGMVAITNMENGGFATACNENVNNGIVITLFAGPLTAPTGRICSLSNDNVEEIVYNSLRHTHYIRGFSYSYCHALNCISYPYSSTKRVTTTNCRWTSITNADNNQHEILSGFDHSSYTKMFWLYDEMYTNNCVNVTVKNNSNGQLNDSRLTKTQERKHFTREMQTEQVKASQCELKVKCL